MTQVYLGIGSNIERETSIRDGLAALKSSYGQLQISPVYESKAYGFEGDDFYNLVVSFETDIDIDGIEKQLKEIERQSGRRQSDSSYCPRTLDIDLLLFGDLVCDKHELPRVDITEYAFVLKPLCDLAPDLLHPVEKKTMSELWNSFNNPDQGINKIQQDFNL
ncbi:MAG: 2-amino-4-hydroxy-6-hydroxymethyldihydropteridine diphosphokinase [Proteobacteria bacterium]|nr:2-amino-4-hydroxy-6-hydroxymethyldihydropteridine diphosphokinase [Pseudomonadota bacterium]NOG61056.1 2-amino-4-hydroxy-6-hydroxymethyldihydropteridine diphosphokinase [Pseudomonadota bacterium]